MKPTKSDLRYLLALLEQEINRCGLDTPAGRKAKEVRGRMEQML